MNTLRVEDTEEFQRIDAMVSAYDSEGDGPLRKGESVFNWSTVELLCLKIAHQGSDLRVGIWLIRAALASLNIGKFCLALERIAEMIVLPEGQLEPLVTEAENDIKVHELILSWLHSSAFNYGIHKIKLTNISDLTLGEIFLGVEGSIKISKDENKLLIQWLQRCLHAVTVIDKKLYPEESHDKKLSKNIHFFISILNKLKTSEIEKGSYEKSSFELNSIRLDDPVSRNEVHEMLNQIIYYFERQEPSHPAPIFIKRVQRMLGVNFQTLMDELYVDADQLMAKLDKPK